MYTSVKMRGKGEGFAFEFEGMDVLSHSSAYDIDSLVKLIYVTHCWGKYHSSAGLQFYKFGFNCFITFKSQHIFFLGQIQSC